MQTERLIMRRWRETDRAAFAEMNRDPEVMEHFPAPLTREQSDLFVDRIEQGFERHGWGLWALEERGSGAFVGFTGLQLKTFASHFTPAADIGWRLARPAWGKGYATEAAARALAYGFEEAGLDEIVAMTAVGNARSRAVMERLGMTRDPADDFDHPDVPEGSPLRRHVLYRARRPAR
uniref:GNAT family N-acetyltransferase n=1 Tax=Nonomuraea pusilla TaxID=46177 RepID=UPI000A7448D1|nr:GNAT family N-acetyltransferase [Nonomuraea pusilla]